MDKGPIQLTLTREAYVSLKRSITVAQICRQLSPSETFVALLLKKMDSGDKEWKCEIKNDLD